ncbi:rod shape-determining protein MreC [Pleurocapsales cyanobacterium LEGE 06147]|nr:rod shape-determining protein MreC [Pleurocapsales cyanobacterium LEGE 06147]
MGHWWIKHGLSTTLICIAISAAWFLEQTGVAPLTEIYYFLVSPFLSKQQLILEDKLTNARILELEQRIAELEQQNQQLQKFLDYSQNQQQPIINAPIIGRSADRWWQQVTLGKGKNDGIEQGFIVTGIGGLVGRVIQVTPHTSRVLLISDANSRVGAVVSRSRHLGFIQGGSYQTVVMRFFTKVADVRPGDTIATSHLSRLYPSGFPLGKVKSVNVNSGEALEAEIELTAPLNLLEWVLVHPFTPKLEPTSETLLPLN